MIVRPLCVAAMAGTLAVAAACGGSAPPSTSPAIALVTPRDGKAVVEVTGLSGETLRALDNAHYPTDRWPALLRIAVGPDDPPVLGEYRVDGGAIRFTPAFPFDHGRQYQVRFDPAQLPGATDPGIGPLTASIGLPASTATPTTVVTQVYPSGDLVPENLLRMYIQFSAPMGRPSGLEHLQLLDENGTIVSGPFLPLDYQFWNPDRTRFTVFFDPGRVKQGILPNRQMGRALRAGHTYTLTVSADWRDANGLSLKEPFRRAFRAGPADDRPLDPSRWSIHPPAASRAPLIVTFPEPLDYGLMLRAIGVTRDGTPLDGDVGVEAAEQRWTFTPRDAWRPGAYQLLALSLLEDRAGNQIGRAFEIDNFDTVDKDPDPKTVTLPFTYGPR